MGFGDTHIKGDRRGIGGGSLWHKMGDVYTKIEWGEGMLEREAQSAVATHARTQRRASWVKKNGRRENIKGVERRNAQNILQIAAMGVSLLFACTRVGLLTSKGLLIDHGRARTLKEEEGGWVGGAEMGGCYTRKGHKNRNDLAILCWCCY